ncbi:hypothetical protein WISP_150567 [Willisornis vidua]|uniref:Uncharacterized protein n=1 Tax=Willisornis vidua TaxID=1566151 RepID=A0ABQ9CNH9_9PASS|nr:hypothetical protein WISP_150567 [Willisornis vidua]
MICLCVYSPESQLYPGLHQKKCGQQVKEGDPHMYFGLVGYHVDFCIPFWSSQLLMAVGMDWMIFEGPFQLKPFCDDSTQHVCKAGAVEELLPLPEETGRVQKAIHDSCGH